MIVVVDTNAVLGAFTEGHVHRPILDAWLDGRLTWAVSTEILLEYEEILARRSGPERAAKALHLIEVMADAELCPRIDPHFQWRLISADPDDNKFADCAIAAEAEWIITEDAHFDALKNSGHKPQPLTPAEFIARFLSEA
jgi:putative PIN family toxin of toxin-antitoxin system